jgi:2-dehydro-3-deoxy-D-arabinonate dehydratase
MQLGQVRQGDRFVAVIIESRTARLRGSWAVRMLNEPWSMVDLIQRAEAERVPLTEFATSHSGESAEVELAIPIAPLEVWAAGSNYESNSMFRDQESGRKTSVFTEVFRSARPHLFFKGTARNCVGGFERIGIRSDSKRTISEPELAVVLGGQGKVLGYTLANNVSAWDLETENPLYRAQSKIYTASCSLGPVIVTKDELSDPYNLPISIRIERGRETIFESSMNTSDLGRPIESVIEYLLRSNAVLGGSVLCTGTNIIFPSTAALAAGDCVAVECPAIGRLVNTAAIV